MLFPAPLLLVQIEWCIDVSEMHFRVAVGGGGRGLFASLCAIWKRGFLEGEVAWVCVSVSVCVSPLIGLFQIASIFWWSIISVCLGREGGGWKGPD